MESNFSLILSGERDLDEGVECSGGQVSRHRLRRCSRTVSRSHGTLQVIQACDDVTTPNDVT